MDNKQKYRIPFWLSGFTIKNSGGHVQGMNPARLGFPTPEDFVSDEQEVRAHQETMGDFKEVLDSLDTAKPLRTLEGMFH